MKIKRRVCWKLFSYLPKKKNKVVMQSFYGRGYSDNPKPIAGEMLWRGGYDIYWVVKSELEAKTLPDEITPIYTDTVRSIFHLCTAGIWVDNSRKWSFTKKGKGQYYLQCWHGFPLKRIEKDAAGALGEAYVASAKKDSSMIDLMLSNSAFLTDIYHTAFWYDGEVLEGGFPRNDVLVKGDEKLTKKVYDYFKLDPETKIMLYAPTFRKGMGLETYDVDYKSCCEALNEKLGGKWIIFAKLHPNVASKSSEMNLDENYVINASDYSDIQELYIASSAMLSDYSSVMFDYIATGKPCFLYVNDLQDYKDDRNFYFDISRLPFCLAENNEQLIENIKSFDLHKQRQDCASFCADFGIVESGISAKNAVDKIEEMRGVKR